MDGLRTVEDFVLDGQARPPLFTDEARRRRVVFDGPHRLAILLDDTRESYHLNLDPGGHALILAKRADPEWKSALCYQRLDSYLLAMEGTFGGQKIRARLRRATEPRFRLIDHGLHWIIEYPHSH